MGCYRSNTRGRRDRFSDPTSRRVAPVFTGGARAGVTRPTNPGPVRRINQLSKRSVCLPSLEDRVDACERR